jgi:Icc-related predicted phosphoesterase
MTTLAVVGDVHAHFDRLTRVLDRIREVDPEGVLLVGDLGSHHVNLKVFRTPEGDALYQSSVELVLEQVCALGVPVLWVPGNHDLPTVRGPGNIDHGAGAIGELTIAGIGGSGPHRHGFSYEWDEEDIRARPVSPCDVLLVHCPPLDTPLDYIPFRQEHAGSLAIRERAERQMGFLVCGHIHESPGAVQLGDCLCMNVGGLGHPFGAAQVGFIRREEGVDEAWHEDLKTGEVQRWRRA